jgi:diguanylate cyclase (GGDEF)-like protein
VERAGEHGASLAVLVLGQQTDRKKEAHSALSAFALDLNYAASCQAAVEACATRPIGLVLLLGTLSDGDWADCCSRLRSEPGRSNPLILALSSAETDHEARQALLHGADDLVFDPLAGSLRPERLAHLLQSRTPPREPQPPQPLPPEPPQPEPVPLEPPPAVQSKNLIRWDPQTGRLLAPIDLDRCFELVIRPQSSSVVALLRAVISSDRALVRRMLQRAHETETPVLIELRLRREDGTSQPALMRAGARIDAETGQREMQAEIEDLSDRVIAESQNTATVQRDQLTGLPNRILFRDRLEQLMARARRTGHPIAVMLLDVDALSRVNEALGHAAGDALLRSVAERLVETLRASDSVMRAHPSDLSVARIGGDEFVVALSELRDVESAVPVTKRLLDKMREPVLIDGRLLHSSVCVGISTFPNDGTDADRLISNAGTAMNKAKLQGAGSYRFFEDTMDTTSVQRLSLERDLREALGTNQLSIFYQPQVDVRNGEVVGLEALIRWQHPNRGFVPPSELIAVAEQSELISEIGKFALARVCEDIPELHAQLKSLQRVAVNVSGKQVRDPEFPNLVDSLARDLGISVKSIELEITETEALDDAANTLLALRDLRQRGFRIGIDDFGTGFSSLSYLRRFPVDTLKLDRAFVREIASTPVDRGIAHAILTLAAGLSLDTVAEGVERPDQREILIELGCHVMQGFLFARPTPKAELLRRFATVPAPAR